MASITGTNVGSHGHDAHPHESYLAPKSTMWATIIDWATTVDHKKIGVMYLVAILFMFFLGGIAALAVRLELLQPTRTIVSTLADGTVKTEIVGQLFRAAGAANVAASNDLYNKIFTLHGLIMVFLVIVPSVPASLGNFLIPLMLGAKDVAFPRLNLASWYI